MYRGLLLGFVGDCIITLSPMVAMLVHPFNGHIPWGLLQVLQLTLYLTKYGEISLAIAALCQILHINFFGGLESNHKCMNIIVFKNCRYFV